jgi:hypothetical protein
MIKPAKSPAVKNGEKPKCKSHQGGRFDEATAVKRWVERG